MTTYNGFTFSTDYKIPSNTIGVYSPFYFGSIDGVEVGPPCDSEQECLQSLESLLYQTEPYTLADLLTESVECYESLLPKFTQNDRVSVEERLAREKRLLEKVMRFNSNERAVQ